MSPSSQATPPQPRKLFKNILQGTGIYLVGSVAQRLIGLLMVPITTRCLTTAEFGIADLLSQCTDVLSMLLGARFGSAVGFFYFEKDNAENRRAVVTTSILGAFLLGAVATLICRPFSEPLARFVFGDTSIARYFNLLLLLMPATFVTEAAFSLLRVEDRPVAFILMSFLSMSMQVAGVLTLVAFFKLHVMGIVYTSCTNATVLAILMGVSALRRFRSKFDSQVFTRMLKYSLPLGLAGIATFFIHVGDRFILPHYRSFDDLGIYVLAYKFGMLLSFVYGAFHSYWTAQVFAVMRREDSDTVFARIFTYVLLTISFAAVGLVVCSRPAVRIMAPPPYMGAVGLIPIVVAAYFIRAIGDFLRCIFLAANRPGFDAVCNWVGAASCAAGYWLLIPRYGMWGAAYATLAAFSVIGIISVTWTYKVRRYRVETVRLLKIAAASLISLLPYVALRRSTLPMAIGVAALSVGLFPVTLWFLRFPTPGEWGTAMEFLAGVRRKLARA